MEPELSLPKLHVTLRFCVWEEGVGACDGQGT